MATGWYLWLAPSGKGANQYLAKTLNVSRTAVYNWEKGSKIDLAKHGAALSTLLDISIEDLIRDNQGKCSKAMAEGLSVNYFHFKERIKWAIDYIVAEFELSNEKLANLAGLSTSTIDGYRRKLRVPKTEFFAFLCDKYDFYLEWFIYGNGEPFPGARFKYPEVCAKVWPEEQNQRSQAPEFSIAEDLTLAAKVLESRTHYATALHLNIRSFAGAVNDSSTLNSVLARLEDLEGKFDKMQLENKNLRDEIKKLKGNSGGSAPIALGMDHAAPTGTEGQET